jgi:hypothetical protein
MLITALISVNVHFTVVADVNGIIEPCYLICTGTTSICLCFLYLVWESYITDICDYWEEIESNDKIIQ